jgi:flagellin
MRINTNVSALNSQRILGQTNAAAASQIGKLSSGFRINKASDDAAGLGIANRLRADIRSLGQAARNAEQATSMLQVMEGATTQISSIVERMKELATQANSAASGEDNGAAKTQLNAEFVALRGELDRIVGTTTFNGQTLLAGGFGASVTGGTWDGGATGVHGVQLNGTAADTYTLNGSVADKLTMTNGAGVAQTIDISAGKGSYNFSSFGITLETNDSFTAGAGSSSNAATIIVSGTASGSFMVSSSGNYGGSDLVSVNAVDVRSATLGIDSDSLLTAASAITALGNLDTAIGSLNTETGKIGAAQNRIDYALRNVQTTIENTAAAESTIRDADMAAEMTEFSRVQILQQAGVAMLAQANQAPQAVLQLLR